MFPMGSEGRRGVAPHWGHSGGHSDGSLGEKGTPELVPMLTFHWPKLAVSTHHIKRGREIKCCQIPEDRNQKICK